MMCSEERHRKTDKQTFTFNWNSRDNPIRCRHDINSNVGGPHILTTAYLGPTKPAFLVFELASRALSASNFQVPTPPTPLSFWVSYLCLLILSERETDRETERESHLKLKPTQLPTLWSLSFSVRLSGLFMRVSQVCVRVCVCVWVSCVFIIYVPLIWCVFMFGFVKLKEHNANAKQHSFYVFQSSVWWKHKNLMVVTFSFAFLSFESDAKQNLKTSISLFSVLSPQHCVFFFSYWFLLNQMLHWSSSWCTLFGLYEFSYYP